MSLTLGSLLYPFGAYLVAFALLALLDVWHMVRFGTYGIRNYLALFAFLAGTAIILWGTAQLLAGVDWAMPLVSGVTISLPRAVL